MSVVRVCPRAASYAAQAARTRAKVSRTALGVAVERALHESEQVVGRPPLERVRAQLPRQVLVVGTHPAGDREDDVEQPRHRLGGVEPGLEGAAVAVVLERAVGEVDPAVEPVVVDEHGVGLVRVSVAWRRTASASSPPVRSRSTGAQA